MTAYVVFIALFVSAHYALRRGLEFAFLYVWIPILLCLPFGFTAHIPMVPIRTFCQAAVVPILVILVRDHGHRLRWGRMEMLMVSYAVWRVIADYDSRGYKDAQNYAFYMLSCVLGPYLIGAYVIRNRAMDIKTAKLFVLIFLLFFPFFIYEAKFWVSPIFKLLSPLFPGAFSGLSMRYGMARTAGTFEHPILACIMIIAVYRLHRWLAWTGEWKQPQAGLLGRLQAWSRPIPGSFALKISIVLIVMALMTLSRGPWIGGLAGAILAAAGNWKHRKQAMLVVLVVFVVGGIGGKLALDAYTSAENGQVIAEEAQTMIYRKVMIEKYVGFIFERPWLGWGLTTVPVIKGMESIDNALFLMALQHGMLAPVIFVVMFAYAIGTQLAHGLKSPAGIAPLGFTFSGIYLMCFFSFTTVYMGAQTEPLLFLLLGWGEGMKARAEPSAAAPSLTLRPSVAPNAGFRRLLT